MLYEEKRKCLGVGGLSAVGGEAAAVGANHPGSCRNCRCFRIGGKAMASGFAERRTGSPEKQSPSWSTVTFESGSETTIDRNFTRRSTQSGLPHGPLDLRSRCRSRFENIWRRVSSVAHLETASRTWLDMPEARTAGKRTRRSCHRALARTRVASDKKGAKRNRRPLIFLDESGFMLQPVCRRTWSPSGQTPVQYAWDRHDRLSAIALIGMSPIRRRLSLYFQLLPHNVDAFSTISLLEELHRYYRCKVTLVWDRWSVHRSAAAHFKTNHPDWFDFEWLPAYAPDLNPVELCWSHSKYSDLANFIPNDLNDLKMATTESLRTQTNNQDLLRSYFNHCKLKI